MPIPKEAMEQNLQYVGQIFTAVGTKDPRYNIMGSIAFRLGRQLVDYASEEPAPSKFRPIPILHCLDVTAQIFISQQQAIVDLD